MGWFCFEVYKMGSSFILSDDRRTWIDLTGQMLEHLSPARFQDQDYCFTRDQSWVYLEIVYERISCIFSSSASHDYSCHVPRFLPTSSVKHTMPDRSWAYQRYYRATRCLAWLTQTTAGVFFRIGWFIGSGAPSLRFLHLCLNKWNRAVSDFDTLIHGPLGFTRIIRLPCDRVNSVSSRCGWSSTDSHLRW
jgi:hypothetical protein